MQNTIGDQIMDLYPVGKKKTTHKIMQRKTKTPREEFAKAHPLTEEWRGGVLFAWSTDGELHRRWQQPFVAEEYQPPLRQD